MAYKTNYFVKNQTLRLFENLWIAVETHCIAWQIKMFFTFPMTESLQHIDEKWDTEIVSFGIFMVVYTTKWANSELSSYIFGKHTSIQKKPPKWKIKRTIPVSCTGRAEIGKYHAE